MVGDTEYDMQMAVSAGATGLGVTYGVHDREHLLKHGAVNCLDDLRQLPDWLSGQSS
jgi:phosphoglycolate phosphatase